MAKKKRRIKACPIPREDFEKLARASSLTVLPPEMVPDYVDNNGAVPDWCFYDEAAAVCRLSIPTFKLRARQFLMPEVFGELPEEFFDETKVGMGMVGFKDNAHYDRYPRYAAMRNMMMEEDKKKRVVEASDLPTLE